MCTACIILHAPLLSLSHVQVNFVDNQDVLDLIERRILHSLDDQTRLKTGSDATFFKTILDANSANPKFKQIRRPLTDTAFGTLRLVCARPLRAPTLHA